MMLKKYDDIYRMIYDRKISVKEFKQWLDLELRKAYDKGIRDADSEPSYDDISKSQYD